LEKENVAKAKRKFGKQQRRIDENKYSRKNQKKKEAITDYRKHI
jgi:hypothetical protein